MRPKCAIFLFVLLWGASAQAQYIVKNNGQWDAQALYKLPMHYGAIYFESDGILIEQADPEGKAFYAKEKHYHDLDEQDAHDAEHPLQRYHTYKMKWLGANKNVVTSGAQPLKTYHNYLLGNDKSKWQSKVPLYEGLLYTEVYKGIDVRFYFSERSNLKYDIEVKPHANPALYKTQYRGVDNLYINNDGILIIKNSIAEAKEMKPYAYQLVDGEKREVLCGYKISGNIVSFALGTYDTELPLIIDPELILSTFSGSTSNNFGFTATPGKDGSIYGGGIVFGTATTTYPTLGAAVDTFSGGVIDIGITKFSADGSQLIYSTYLGGNSVEMPYSLIEAKDGSLYILGNTGSSNFPVSLTAAQDSFYGGDALSYANGSYANGIDLFVTKLDSTGGQILGSSFVGGNKIDGVYDLLGYYDRFRGEITVDSTGNAFVACHTASTQFPFPVDVSKADITSPYNAFVVKLNNDLSTIDWATLYGGDNLDGVLSLKLSTTHLFAAGVSTSTNLPTESDVIFPQPPGAATNNGFVLKLNQTTGAHISSTYTGGTGNNLTYFIDVDQNENIYTYGIGGLQMPVSDPAFVHNPSGMQVLQKISGALDTILRSTTFGTTFTNPQSWRFAPSAFEVDRCGNILLSGWGNDAALPVTGNAFQSTIAGGDDYYFFVLDESWKKINYATFFGGNKSEHVDGGTSRFSEDGTIYQAVCASCQNSASFPTTPNAYSNTNAAFSSDPAACNLAVLKFSTDANEVVANVFAEQDTVCPFETVNLIDSSYNADYFIITNPDGTVLTQSRLTNVVVPNQGINRYFIAAIDSTCSGVDSIEVIIYAFDFSDQAVFTVNNDSCIASLNPLRIDFIGNYSSDFTGVWHFGDGDSSTQKSPTHTYPSPGTYTTTLYISSSGCSVPISYTKTFTLHPIAPLSIGIQNDACENGTVSFSASGDGYHEYRWLIDTVLVSTTKHTQMDFEKDGSAHSIVCIAYDSICKRTDTISETFYYNFAAQSFSLPNVFTPNGDGQNDYFGLIGDFTEDDFKRFTLQIYNRWGQLVYSVANPSEKWDGAMNTEILPEGVYFYLVNYLSACDLNESKKGYVHLLR